jgi:hypothetical protein
MDLRVGGCGLDASGSGYWTVVVSYEHRNELLSFKKGGNFTSWVTVRFSRWTVPWVSQSQSNKLLSLSQWLNVHL